MKNYKIALLVFFTLLLSCQENSDETAVLEPEAIFEKDEALDALAHQFANLLATSLKDESMRSFIKEEAVAKFDGDYDILFAAAKDKEVSGLANSRGQTLTFEEALYSSTGTARTTSDEFDQLLVQLETEYPTMQISVPDLETIAPEDWETASMTPLVAVLESDFDESTTDFVTAYDSDGNTYELSTTEDPDRVTVVIAPSERVLAFAVEEGVRVATNDCFLADPILKTQIYDYYFDDDVLIDCGGTGGGSTGGGTGGGSTATCDDENIHRLFLDKYGLKAIESWVSGAPEIWCYVYTFNDGYDTKPKKLGKWEPSRRKYINGKWWPVNGSVGNDLFDWDSGSEFVLWFWEHDPIRSILAESPSACDVECVDRCGDLYFPTPYKDWNCIPRRHDYIGVETLNLLDFGDCNEEKKYFISVSGRGNSGTFIFYTRRQY